MFLASELPMTPSAAHVGFVEMALENGGAGGAPGGGATTTTTTANAPDAAAAAATFIIGSPGTAAGNWCVKLVFFATRERGR